jgi:hypothetical protein
MQKKKRNRKKGQQGPQRTGGENNEPKFAASVSIGAMRVWFFGECRVLPSVPQERFSAQAYCTLAKSIMAPLAARPGYIHWNTPAWISLAQEILWQVTERGPTIGNHFNLNCTTPAAL